MNLKNSIKKQFEEQGCLMPIDDTLLDELIFNIELCNKAKEEIRTFGIVKNITKDPRKDPFFQKNRALDVYNLSLKNIVVLCRTLNISKEGKKMLLELAAKKPTLDSLDSILMDNDE